MPPDTIAAVATPSGNGGVGIIRLSGTNAVAIVSKLVGKDIARQKARMLCRAVIHDPNTHEPIDDILLVVFPAPHSLTGESVVELQGHGGSIVLKRILSLCLTHGARLAQAGEFSQRAFLNGKMDLTQAEAVADLIGAETAMAQRAASRQLKGLLRDSVTAIGSLLQESLAQIEASIDFPEEVGEIVPMTLLPLLQQARRQSESLLAIGTYGKRLQSGVVLVIAGAPNVGKSSLLNALVGYDRAIVTPIAGTTRDIVEEPLEIAGVPVRLLDTAGIRETEDVVERIGVIRSHDAIEKADLVIAVLDAERTVLPDELQFLQSLVSRSVVLAINKTDTGDFHKVQNALDPYPFPIVPLSAKRGDGISMLMEAIARVLFGNLPTSDGAILTSARHEEALRRTVESLRQAEATLQANLPAELIAVDLHGALQALGEITGETVRETIIEGIFSRFCIGK